MSFKTWADSKVKKIGFVDLQLIKLSCFVFALMIAKLWEPLLTLEWYWYAVIAVLAAIKPAYRALEK